MFKLAQWLIKFINWLIKWLIRLVEELFGGLENTFLEKCPIAYKKAQIKEKNVARHNRYKRRHFYKFKYISCPIPCFKTFTCQTMTFCFNGQFVLFHMDILYSSLYSNSICPMKAEDSLQFEKMTSLSDKLSKVSH